MGYLHIDNLYKNKTILLYKECYALEKIHGTSAHITWKDKVLSFFSGGAKLETFEALFDREKLLKNFQELGLDKTITIYGEAYGGKMQAMAHTYGKDLKFVAFDVRIGDVWLNVPFAKDFVQSFGLDFVAGWKTLVNIGSLTLIRDLDSPQSLLNINEKKKMEGIILRPLEEFVDSFGNRVIAKYKRKDFRETKTPRPVFDKLKIWKEAKSTAEEWVTLMRLTHILDKIENPSVEKIPDIIKAMLEDVKREGEGEIDWSPSTQKEIAKRTVKLFKQETNNSV
jgi:hypothetical protein